MGVSVEDGEEADHSARDPERGFRREGNHESEEDGGEGDAGFHARERDAHDAERAAEGHDDRKCDGQEPDGGSAEVGAPEADGDHGGHVVEAIQRMQEAVGESASTVRLVGVREGGKDDEEADRMAFLENG